MKKILLICLLILGSFIESMGSHILGGEITYEHVTDLKYDVFITLYRDCDECLLNGRGGGGSTKDCGSFDLFLRSSDANGCAIKELDKFKPVFQSYNKVLSTCSNARQSCEDNSNFSYGVEAHHYSVRVDFEQYSNFKNCGFELYVKMSERAGDLTNISDDKALFYNYAYIYPSEFHSSPTFNSKPEFLLQCNQSFRQFIAADVNSHDSLDVTLKSALKDRTSELTYKSGYSAKSPVKVHCPGGPGCKGDISKEPVQGVYLDKSSSYLAFTPTQCSEKSVIVYELRKWERTKDGMKLVSIVRRDIQHEVVQTSNFNPKLEVSKTSFEVCPGDEVCFTVSSDDKTWGRTGIRDSTSLDYLTNASGATVSIQQRGRFQDLRFCWKPDSSHSRDQDYHLMINVSDNACPLIGHSSIDIKIKVKEKPIFDIKSESLDCGYAALSTTKPLGSQISNYDWKVFNGQGTVVSTQKREKDTVKFNESGVYRVLLTARNDQSCANYRSLLHSVEKSDLLGPSITLKGIKTYCEGEGASIEAQVEQTFNIDSTKWELSNLSIQYGEGAYVNHAISKQLDGSTLRYKVWSKRNGLNCESSIDTSIDVESIPRFSLLDKMEFCSNQENVDLNSYISPSPGSWSSVGNLIKDQNLLYTSSIEDPHHDQSKTVNYSFIDERTSCQNDTQLTLDLIGVPQVEMLDLHICRTEREFLLNNAIARPFDINGLKVEWSSSSSKLPIRIDDDRYWLDLSKLSTGNYTISARFTNSSNCSSVGTFNLVLADKLEIDYQTPAQLCQGDSKDLSDLLNVSPEGGHWNSSTHFDLVEDGRLNGIACGKVKLQYTYDQFGCFGTENLEINIPCKPQVKFEQDGNSYCLGESGLTLIAEPNNGVWEHPNVLGKHLSFEQGPKKYSLKYKLDFEGCSFSYPVSINTIPSVSHSALDIPEQLCKGDKLIFNDLHIRDGKLDVRNGGAVLMSYEEGSHNLDLGEQLGERASYEFRFTSLSDQCPPQVVDIDIPIQELPTFEFDKIDKDLCEPFELNPLITTIENSIDWSENKYEWLILSNGTDNKTYHGRYPTMDLLSDGVHVLELKVISEAGCSYSQTMPDIVVYDQPEAYFVTDPEGPYSLRMTDLNFINSTACKDEVSYSWDFGIGASEEISPSFSFPKTTASHEVVLTATSSRNCVDTYSKTIEIQPDIRIDIPNAFSPNNKPPAKTETFKVSATNVKDFEIHIANRWGEIVYHSTDVNFEWDGTFKGVMCQQGIYVYVIKAKSLTNKEYDFNGTINLLR